jgi:hypothetical protein
MVLIQGGELRLATRLPLAIKIARLRRSRELVLAARGVVLIARIRDQSFAFRQLASKTSTRSLTCARASRLNQRFANSES